MQYTSIYTRIVGILGAYANFVLYKFKLLPTRRQTVCYGVEAPKSIYGGAEREQARHLGSEIMFFFLRSIFLCVPPKTRGADGPDDFVLSVPVKLSSRRAGEGAGQRSLLTEMANNVRHCVIYLSML